MARRGVNDRAHFHFSGSGIIVVESGNGRRAARHIEKRRGTVLPEHSHGCNRRTLKFAVDASKLKKYVCYAMLYYICRLRCRVNLKFFGMVK